MHEYQCIYLHWRNHWSNPHRWIITILWSMVLYPKFDTCAVVSLTMQVMVSATIYKQIILRAAYYHILTIALAIAFAIFQIVKLNVFLPFLTGRQWCGLLLLFLFSIMQLFSRRNSFITNVQYFVLHVPRFTTYYSYYYTRFKNDSILLELVMSWHVLLQKSS